MSVVSKLLWPVLAIVFALIALGALLKKPKVIEREVVRIEEVPVEVIREVEKIVEVPEPIIGIGRDLDLAKTSKGIGFSSEVVVEEGDLAVDDRIRRSSYRSEHTLTVKIPRAASTLEELEKGTTGLSVVFPGFPEILESAKVSSQFETIYQNKVKRLRLKSSQLGELLTLHNFFDCSSMLNLTTKTGRKVFLMQGDMDVVSDGSDGDRLPEMPDEIVNSTHYQPTTSYGWAKTGTMPNPMIAGYEKRIEVARAELADPEVGVERKKWVRSRIRNLLEPGIEEMKRRSFLVAEYDPFIVIPMHIMLDRNDPWAPKVGDYAVVVHDGVVYPAIVGDAGPTFKVGEASLRMARQINERSSPYSRPVSDLSVTYICFPKTAEKPHRTPNYDFWRSRCQELVEEMGGLGEGVELFVWEDRFPKPEQLETEPEDEA